MTPEDPSGERMLASSLSARKTIEAADPSSPSSQPLTKDERTLVRVSYTAYLRNGSEVNYIYETDDSLGGAYMRAPTFARSRMKREKVPGRSYIERFLVSVEPAENLVKLTSQRAPSGKPLTTDERTRLLAIERALRARRLGFDDRLELADEIHRIARPIVVTWPTKPAKDESSEEPKE